VQTRASCAFSVKASLINERLEEEDPNAANDLAAFPVELR
jgi:hypothetical protein